jgi:hypothetical protein
MKLSFVWWWGRASEIYPNWRDGLRGAIEEISKTNHVDIYPDERIPTNTYDAILLWGDSNCPFFNILGSYNARKGMILTTDPTNFDNLRKLDVVFCESTPVYDAVRSQGIRAIKAFGTDVSFFKPSDKKKDIDYFYPATFSPWKRQSAIAYLGKKLLCVGTIQPDGVYEWKMCKDQGVQIREGYFPAETILDFYQRTKRITIPAIHGSERTVLEAMACNILPEVNELNRRTHSYIDEYKESKCRTPREFVEKEYNHIQYAEKILKGLT